jgi:alpha-maltose-1-phosphate synthase
MKGTTVFVGGSIGSDPYDPKTWSGISLQLIRGLDSNGVLDKAVGIELSRVQKTWLMAKNYHPVRSTWRKNFYMDIAYRKALTDAAQRVSVDGPICLQFGHWYSLPSVFPNKKCFSYHDGNLAGSVSSGFNMAGVSSRRIDAALRYEEQVAHQMSAVFTMSDYLRQSFIRDYHLPPERVFNVGAGVSLDSLPTVSPKDYTAPRILFIGIEFERKGGYPLLKAFKIVRNSIPTAELHIVGPEKLEHVPEGVVFHGRLSKKDPSQNAKLESLFRECNLFVLPSLYEPFGIAPLEAMLYRIPCILTDAWAFREFIKPGITGDLVQIGSVEDIAAKTTALLSVPDKLEAMGNSAREHVLSRYTWPAVSARIANLLGAT